MPTHAHDVVLTYRGSILNKPYSVPEFLLYYCIERALLFTHFNKTTICLTLHVFSVVNNC